MGKQEQKEAIADVRAFSKKVPNKRDVTVLYYFTINSSDRPASEGWANQHLMLSSNVCV